MHGMAPFQQLIPRQGCGEARSSWAGCGEMVTWASRCCVCHRVICGLEPGEAAPREKLMRPCSAHRLNETILYTQQEEFTEKSALPRPEGTGSC